MVFNIEGSWHCLSVLSTPLIIFCKASSLHRLMNHQRWQDGRPSGLCQAHLAQQSQQCYTLFRAVGTKGVTKVIHTIPTNFGILLFPMKRSMLPLLLFYVELSTGQQEAPKVVPQRAKPSSPKSCSQLPFQENFVNPSRGLPSK